MTALVLLGGRAASWSRALMESKLLGGTILIVDRYSYSGVAFSAAEGLDIGWCKAPEVGLLAPDLVIYLDVQPEKAAERGGYGGERYERVEFQRRVAEHYHSPRDSTWKEGEQVKRSTYLPCSIFGDIGDLFHDC